MPLRSFHKVYTHHLSCFLTESLSLLARENCFHHSAYSALEREIKYLKGRLNSGELPPLVIPTFKYMESFYQQILERIDPEIGYDEMKQIGLLHIKEMLERIEIEQAPSPSKTAVGTVDTDLSRAALG